MSFTNSAIKGAALTLPSIDGGFGTLNILRDPPKSIHTRYKPKVSDTSKITEWIDNSGDRICEVIKPFARGINPFVSVSYSNYGTNGGQVKDRSGMIGTGQAPIALTGGQSYLPYRVAKDGAFRPPIIPPQQLLPLSRMPKLPKSYTTNIGSIVTCTNDDSPFRCSKDFREIRQDLLKVCSTPRSIFNIETPASQPTETTDAIVDRCSVSASTNNTSSKGSSVQNFAGNQKLPIQNRVHGSYYTNTTGVEQTNYNHSPHILEKNTPSTSLTTNKIASYGSTISCKEYTRAPQRLHRGGFENRGCIDSNKRCQPTIQMKQPTIYQKAAKMMVKSSTY